MTDTVESNPPTETKQEETTTTEPTTETTTTESKPEEKPVDSKPLDEEEQRKVRKQVEFYFSNSNYPKDKFLLAAAKEDPEGFIPLSSLLTFNRMKPLVSTVPQIASALLESNVVVLNADQTKLKRKHPVPDKLDNHERTIYVQNAPKDGTLEDFQDLFSKYGEVCSVRIVRDKQKNSLGNAFVEFSTKEALETVLKETITMKENQLAMSKQLPKPQGNQNKKRGRDENQGGSEPEEKKPKYTHGLVVKVTGIPADSEIAPLKEFFSYAGQVRFVDVRPTVTYVRFDDEACVKAVIDKADQKFNDQPLTTAVLEGEEEEEFWKLALQAQQDRKTRGGGRRGRGRGRRGGR